MAGRKLLVRRCRITAVGSLAAAGGMPGAPTPMTPKSIPPLSPAPTNIPSWVSGPTPARHASPGKVASPPLPRRLLLLRMRREEAAGAPGSRGLAGEEARPKACLGPDDTWVPLRDIWGPGVTCNRNGTYAVRFQLLLGHSRAMAGIWLYTLGNLSNANTHNICYCQIQSCVREKVPVSGQHNMRQ